MSGINPDQYKAATEPTIIEKVNGLVAAVEELKDQFIDLDTRLSEIEHEDYENKYLELESRIDDLSYGAELFGVQLIDLRDRLDNV